MAVESKKQENSFRQQRERWLRAYAEAQCMRERLPQVEQLVLSIAFTDRHGFGTYSPQMRSLSAAAKAFFAIPCPRTLCLDGGFDLDPIILTMLDTNQTASAGTLTCHGWVDPGRAENARCHLELRYEFQTRYDASHVNRARQRIGV
jgi:hypothetical protein